MQIYLLLTENCNLNCDYCIRGKKKYIYVEKEKLFKIIKENESNFKNAQILLTGGEPTLHPDFIEILNYVKEHSKSVSINTNGTIDVFELLPYSKNIHIQISLDGKEEIHDRLRSKGSFKATWNNIQKIDKLGFSYNIATVVNVNNIDTVDELLPSLSMLKGMKYWKLDPQLPFGCGKVNECIDNSRWNDLVDNLIKYTPFKLKIKKMFDFSLLEGLSTNQIKSYAGKCRYNCGSCTSKVYIFPDFTVYPCTCLKNYKLGNLCEDKLEVILKTEAARKFSEYTVLEESQCIKCRYLPICNGGCIGMSQYYYNRLGMGDIRCPLITKK